MEQDVFPQQGVQPNATGADFGAQVGMATQNFGASLGQAGDTFSQMVLRTQGLKNEADAKNADMAFQTDLGQKEAAFMSLSGKAAADAYPGYVASIAALRQQYLGSMTNPMAKQMLDQTLSYTAGRSIRSASSYAGSQQKQYVVDTSDARVQNLITQAANHPLDDGWFGAAKQSIAGEVAQQGRLMGWSPDQVTQQQQKYDSDLWGERIRIIANTDIGAAQKMFQDHADDIDPAHRAAIDASLQNRAYMGMMRAVTYQNRIDAMGEKTLKLQQNAAASNYVADTLGGNPPTTAQLANDLRTGMLNKEGFDWVVAQGKAGAPKDDLQTYDALTAELHAGTLKGTDVMDAASAGKLTTATARSLIKAVEDPTAGKDAVATANHTALIEAIGGGMETSFFPAEQQRTLMNLRAQAQQEWTQRVMVNHEDSTAVLRDMIPRYVQTGSVPVGLAQPKFGPVVDQQSLSIAAQKLKAAHDAGQIDDADFAKNATIIGQYQAFYNLQAKQTAIAKAVKTGKPLPADQGGGGLVPDTSGGQ